VYPPPQAPSVARPPSWFRRQWVLLVVAAGSICLLVLVAAGIVLSTVVARANSDEAKIAALVDDFAVAVDQSDQATIVTLLCAEEASAITEDDDYDPADNGPVTGQQKKPSVTTSDIRVNGETASAKIARPSQSDTTLYFRKEGGGWKVCAPAGDQVSATPGSSG
jgi:ketosteroid isomerase-like protein